MDGGCGEIGRCISLSGSCCTGEGVKVIWIVFDDGLYRAMTRMMERGMDHDRTMLER